MLETATCIVLHFSSSAGAKRDTTTTANIFQTFPPQLLFCFYVVYIHNFGKAFISHSYPVNSGACKPLCQPCHICALTHNFPWFLQQTILNNFASFRGRLHWRVSWGWGWVRHVNLNWPICEHRKIGMHWRILSTCDIISVHDNHLCRGWPTWTSYIKSVLSIEFCFPTNPPSTTCDRTYGQTSQWNWSHQIEW